jgi:hypothetical protein
MDGSHNRSVDPTPLATDPDYGTKLWKVVP